MEVKKQIYFNGRRIRRGAMILLPVGEIVAVSEYFNFAAAVAGAIFIYTLAGFVFRVSDGHAESYTTVDRRTSRNPRTHHGRRDRVGRG